MSSECPREARRISVLLPDLRAGGAERVTLTLINAWIEQGFQVDLVLGGAHGALLSEVPASVNIVDLDTARLRHMIIGVARYMRRVRPEFMLTVMQEMTCVAVLARTLSQTRCRIVATEHTQASRHIQALPNWRGRRLMALAVRYCYPRTDAVIAVSEGVARDLVDNIGVRKPPIRVIYNPINLKELERHANAAAHHGWLYGCAPVLLAVGSLKPAKDFMTLIRAFALLRNLREARLIILGEGSERANLERLASDLKVENDVALPGFVSNPWAWMARATVFVSSSQWEGFSMVLVEALACGAPVVATDCPSGPAEILEGGRWGRLVPEGDVEALASAMCTTLDEPRDSEALKRRAADFSPEVAAQQYLMALGLA